MVLRETDPSRREALAQHYTCYAWPVRPTEEAALDTYKDALLGIYRGEVRTAYDNLTWRRETDAERTREIKQGHPRAWPRVVFDGIPSETWSHLIGKPCPGPPPGQWPIRYIRTVARS